MHVIPRIHRNSEYHARITHRRITAPTGLGPLITPQHAVDQVSQRAPKVLATGQTMLINEENVVLEARVQMGLEPKLYNNRVMVTVDMGVHSVESFEDLTDQDWECFREGNTYASGVSMVGVRYQLENPHLSCWGTLIRYRCCSGPTPSSAQHIRGRAFWWVA